MKNEQAMKDYLNEMKYERKCILEARLKMLNEKVSNLENELACYRDAVDLKKTRRKK